MEGSPIPRVPCVLKSKKLTNTWRVSEYVFFRYHPHSHIPKVVIGCLYIHDYHDYTAMRGYIPHLDSPCKSLCPFRPDHSPPSGNPPTAPQLARLVGVLIDARLSHWSPRGLGSQLRHDLRLLLSKITGYTRIPPGLLA